MARNRYGTTVWGGEFLKSIEAETDTARLSRGKSYANSGKVYDVHLKDTSIRAKVQGNYQPFYQTSLSFTPFAKGDKTFIFNYIDENPLFLADIMNAKLSPLLLQFLQKNEIDLFHGFDMSCSCPDFYGAYACKHIAGLYFMLVNEIDKNPFILFSLRELDLIKHYNIQKDLKIPYPIEIEHLQKNIQETEIKDKDTFTLLQLHSQKEFILSLLEANPPFAPIDYKEVLQEFYKKTAKELPLVLSPIHNEDIQKCQRILQEADITIVLTEDLTGATFTIESKLFDSEEIIKLFEPYIYSHNKNTITITPKMLFSLFISFEDNQGSSVYHYLFYLYRVTYILLQNSAFIPSVYESKESFEIFYKPILSLETLKKQIEYLSNIAPSIVHFNKKQLSQKSQTELLITLILTDVIPHFNFMHKKLKNNPPEISYTFFQAQKYKRVNFEDSNVALGIKNYFAIFDIIQSEYTYKLFIDKESEHSENSYSLSLRVQEQSSQKELPLQESLEIFDKMHIVKFISFLQTFFSQIATLLQKKRITLPQNILEEFLLRTASIITNLGVTVILPKELKNLLRPKLSLSVSKNSKSLQSFFTLDGMLEYNWQIAIGNDFISVSEFEKLLENANELIAFKDNFVVISAQEAKALFAQIKRKTKLNKFDILQAKLSGEADFDIDLENFFAQILQVRV